MSQLHNKHNSTNRSTKQDRRRRRKYRRSNIANIKDIDTTLSKGAPSCMDFEIRLDKNDLIVQPRQLRRESPPVARRGVYTVDNSPTPRGRISGDWGFHGADIEPMYATVAPRSPENERFSYFRPRIGSGGDNWKNQNFGCFRQSSQKIPSTTAILGRNRLSYTRKATREARDSHQRHSMGEIANNQKSGFWDVNRQSGGARHNQRVIRNPGNPRNQIHSPVNPPNTKISQLRQNQSERGILRVGNPRTLLVGRNSTKSIQTRQGISSLGAPASTSIRRLGAKVVRSSYPKNPQNAHQLTQKHQNQAQIAQNRVNYLPNVNTVRTVSIGSTGGGGPRTSIRPSSSTVSVGLGGDRPSETLRIFQKKGSTPQVRQTQKSPPRGVRSDLEAAVSAEGEPRVLSKVFCKQITVEPKKYFMVSGGGSGGQAAEEVPQRFSFDTSERNRERELWNGCRVDTNNSEIETQKKPKIDYIEPDLNNNQDEIEENELNSGLNQAFVAENDDFEIEASEASSREIEAELLAGGIKFDPEDAIHDRLTLIVDPNRRNQPKIELLQKPQNDDSQALKPSNPSPRDTNRIQFDAGGDLNPFFDSQEGQNSQNFFNDPEDSINYSAIPDASKQANRPNGSISDNSALKIHQNLDQLDFDSMDNLDNIDMSRCSNRAPLSHEGPSESQSEDLESSGVVIEEPKKGLIFGALDSSRSSEKPSEGSNGGYQGGVKQTPTFSGLRKTAKQHKLTLGLLAGKLDEEPLKGRFEDSAAAGLFQKKRFHQGAEVLVTKLTEFEEQEKNSKNSKFETELIAAAKRVAIGATKDHKATRNRAFFTNNFNKPNQKSAEREDATPAEFRDAVISITPPKIVITAASDEDNIKAPNNINNTTPTQNQPLINIINYKKSNENGDFQEEENARKNNNRINSNRTDLLLNKNSETNENLLEPAPVENVLDESDVIAEHDPRDYQLSNESVPEEERDYTKQIYFPKSKPLPPLESKILEVAEEKTSSHVTSQKTLGIENSSGANQRHLRKEISSLCSPSLLCNIRTPTSPTKLFDSFPVLPINEELGGEADFEVRKGKSTKPSPRDHQGGGAGLEGVSGKSCSNLHRARETAYRDSDVGTISSTLLPLDKPVVVLRVPELDEEYLEENGDSNESPESSSGARNSGTGQKLKKSNCLESEKLVKNSNEEIEDLLNGGDLGIPTEEVYLKNISNVHNSDGFKNSDEEILSEKLSAASQHSEENVLNTHTGVTEGMETSRSHQIKAKRGSREGHFLGVENNPSELLLTPGRSKGSIIEQINTIESVESAQEGFEIAQNRDSGRPLSRSNKSNLRPNQDSDGVHEQQIDARSTEKLINIEKTGQEVLKHVFAVSSPEHPEMDQTDPISTEMIIKNVEDQYEVPELDEDQQKALNKLRESFPETKVISAVLDNKQMPRQVEELLQTVSAVRGGSSSSQGNSTRRSGSFRFFSRLSGGIGDRLEGGTHFHPTNKILDGLDDEEEGVVPELVEPVRDDDLPRDLSGDVFGAVGEDDYEDDGDGELDQTLEGSCDAQFGGPQDVIEVEPIEGKSTKTHKKIDDEDFVFTS